LELPEDAPVGQNIREYLQLDDTIFTIKLTPNKADCLSILGIAREVSALTGAPLEVLDILPIKEKCTDTVKVKVLADDLCGRFTGRVVKGVECQSTNTCMDEASLGECRSTKYLCFSGYFKLCDARSWDSLRMYLT
jgi:phenylalanyl-tRNA synthetase beta chain